MARLVVKMAGTMVVFLTIAGCVSFCRIDGPYEGKVIDAETRQPLEGVVVLGIWYKYQLTVAGATGEFYDSKEVVTDSNGNFKISGQGLRLFSNVDEMNVVIYKAGYKKEDGNWSGYKTLSGEKIAESDGDHLTFKLRKLSPEERKGSKYGPSRPNIDENRMQLLTNEINKERVSAGKEP